MVMSTNHWSVLLNHKPIMTRKSIPECDELNIMKSLEKHSYRAKTGIPNSSLWGTVPWILGLLDIKPLAGFQESSRQDNEI